MQNSTVTISDPKGAWTFEAVSKTLEAAGAEGPYRMTKVDGKLQERDRPPVYLKAERAMLDKQSERVELEGAVQILQEGIVLEGEQITYDLKQGKVLANAPTKTTVNRTIPRARSSR